MAYPNIKIGQHTYNDISYLRVDRVEGGTADYIYDGLNAQKISLGIIQSNFPSKSSLINRPKIPINIAIEVANDSQ